MNNYYLAVRPYVAQVVARWMEGRDKNQFPADISTFMSQFQPDAAMLDGLLDYARKNGVTRNDNQLQHCRQALMLQLKARVAKVLYQDLGMYKVINAGDPVIEKAKQLVRSGEPVARK
jgi:hypothetical protein